MGILVLCTAYFIKRFPTKNLYISSLLLFSIGVVLNGFAQSFTVMMLGRIMQAAGNGILLSLGQVIPFLNIRVLSHRRMRFATIESVLFYLNMMALAVINPLFIQSACGRSATMSGLLMMPGSILMMLLSPIMGKLYDKIGIRKLFLGGALLLSLGTFFSGWCGGNMLVFAIANTIRCAAVAMLMMPLLTWGVSTLDKQDIASGQSLITSLRTISGALGSTIFMSLEAILEDSIGIMAAMQISYVGMTFVGVLVLVSAIAARRCD